ncbi:MAG: ABC transporter ATP-binding protein, partial [Oceanidesulfovibrio sp.]
MLEVLNLSHRYGSTRVLHDVSFTVAEGEILGLLGPNGAGKSTTMRILTGYLRPSAGRVVFGGRDIQKEPQALRSRLGYMPENVPLYPELTVEEHLVWVARLKGAKDAKRETAAVLDRCGLSGARSKLVRQLSKGYRQRVGLAQAILGPTRLLILDEPTAGLDPQQIRDIRELIRELGREKTILLSTHILPEV